MKILIPSHFPTKGSGSGIYVSSIAKELMKLGHDVLVITPEHSKIKEHFKTEPIIFHNGENKEYELSFNFPCFTTHPASNNTFYELTDEQRNSYVDAFEKKILKACNEFKPDIIHAQHIWVASYVASKTGIPYIATAHGTCQMGFQKQGGEPYREMALKAAQNAKRIFAISKPIMNDVIKLYGVPKHQVVLMSNGMDKDKFYVMDIDKDKVLRKYNIPHYDTIVSFAGKFTHFKGIDVLIRAAGKYEKELGEVATIVMGGGDLENEIKKLVKNLGLKHIYFTGPLPQEEVAKIFNIASVSVAPSRREPFGLVAIEALACGTPVIATNEGGFPEFINEKVGGLVEVDSVEQLASKVIKAISEDWKSKKGEYAAEYAKEGYSWEGIVKKMVEIYEEVLNN